MTYLTCAYYGLFLSLVLLPSGLWLLGKRLRQGRTWGLLLGSVGAALLLDRAGGRSPITDHSDP